MEVEMKRKRKSCVWGLLVTSDKVDFTTKTVNKRQRRGLHNDKGISPQRRHNVCKNIYVPSIGAPKYKKQILIDVKREMQYSSSRGL